MQRWDSSARRCFTQARERSAAMKPRFIAEIAKHWATDPKYAEKLLSVLKSEVNSEMLKRSV